MVDNAQGCILLLTTFLRLCQGRRIGYNYVIKHHIQTMFFIAIPDGATVILLLNDIFVANQHFSPTRSVIASAMLSRESAGTSFTQAVSLTIGATLREFTRKLSRCHLDCNV